MCNLNIYAVKIPSALSKKAFSDFVDYIPSHRQDKIRKYVRQEDAIRSLFGQLLLQDVIQKECHILKEDLIFSRNEYGKPYIYNLTDYHFNISHSGEYVVCVTHNQPVGIDIEYIKPISLEIAQQYFSKEEYNLIISQSKMSQISFFFDFWTLKESFIKAIGKGLYMPLNSFAFSITEEKEFILKINPYPERFFFKQYDIDPEYKLSVCAKSLIFPQEVNVINYKNLIPNLIYIK